MVIGLKRPNCRLGIIIRERERERRFHAVSVIEDLVRSENHACRLFPRRLQIL